MIRTVVVLVVLIVLFLGVALLPGKMEGVYFQGAQCMCDSVNFTEYRNGKMIVYGTAHPPAQIYYRYETGADNVTTIYSLPFRDGESEEVFARAYPHLLVTRFVMAGTGERDWVFRRPEIGRVAKAMKEQEITTSRQLPDRSVITTFYDRTLNPVRTEVKLPKFRRDADTKSKARED